MKKPSQRFKSANKWLILILLGGLIILGSSYVRNMSATTFEVDLNTMSYRDGGKNISVSFTGYSGAYCAWVVLRPKDSQTHTLNLDLELNIEDIKTGVRVNELFSSSEEKYIIEKDDERSWPFRINIPRSPPEYNHKKKISLIGKGEEKDFGKFDILLYLKRYTSMYEC